MILIPQHPRPASIQPTILQAHQPVATHHVAPDVFQATPKTSPQFGQTTVLKQPYQGFFLFTDFNCASSTQEAVSHYRDVQQFLTGLKRQGKSVEGFPWVQEALRPVKSVLPGKLPAESTFADIPSGDVNYAAITLLRLAGNRKNRDIFVSVVDPGVGNVTQGNGEQQHDRSILVTKNHGVVISPNNGSLGLLVKALESQGEPYDLLPIDLDKVEAFERIRREDPAYRIPETFHGRDVFGIVGAAVAAGIDPAAFEDTRRRGQFSPRLSPFAQKLKPVPVAVGESAVFQAVRDRTGGDSSGGNLKTSLQVTPELANQLYEEKAVFEVRPAPSEAARNPLHAAKNLLQGVLERPQKIRFQKYFAQVPPGDLLVYAGSTYAPDGKSRFLEIAVNGGNASRRFNIHNGPEERALEIRRVQ